MRVQNKICFMYCFIGVFCGCWTTQPSVIPLKKAQEDIPVLFEMEEIDVSSEDSNQEGQTTNDDEMYQQAQLHVFVRSGYAHDPIGKEGLSQITTDMLRDGGKVYEEKKWKNRLQNLGVEEIETYVGPEIVQFTISSSLQDLHLAASVFEQMFEGNWREESLQKAKEKQRQQIDISYQLQQNQEHVLGRFIFYNWIFEGHPYGHLPSGRFGSIEQITLDDVQSFFQQRFIRERSRIGVSIATPNPKQQNQEEWKEHIEKREEIAEFQNTLSHLFTPTVYKNVTPRRLQQNSMLPSLVAINIEQMVSPSFESRLYMGQSVDISPQDKDFLAMLLAIYIVNDAPKISGNTALLNQNMDVSGNIVFGIHPNYMGKNTLETLKFDSLQQGIVWMLPLHNTQVQTEYIESQIKNWETLISIGVSKEEFLVYRSQLAEHLNHASVHTKLQWRMQLDILDIDVSLEQMIHHIQNLQYDEVNAAIERHISTKNMRAMILTASHQEKEILQADTMEDNTNQQEKEDLVTNKNIDVDLNNADESSLTKTNRIDSSETKTDDTAFSFDPTKILYRSRNIEGVFQ